jgi:type II secretory pathway pseudopilin PulG
MIVDLTGIACSVIAGAFSLLSVLVPILVNSRMKDRQAAEALSSAIRNSLGALQQATSEAARALHPQVTVRNVPETLQPAVAYVLEHAGPEAERLGVTPEKIASKVQAQIGLAEIKTNVAVASSAVPVVPDPLGPVPHAL